VPRGPTRQRRFASLTPAQPRSRARPLSRYRSGPTCQRPFSPFLPSSSRQLALFCSAASSARLPHCPWTAPSPQGPPTSLAIAFPSRSFPARARDRAEPGRVIRFLRAVTPAVIPAMTPLGTPAQDPQLCLYLASAHLPEPYHATPRPPPAPTPLPPRHCCIEHHVPPRPRRPTAPQPTQATAKAPPHAQDTPRARCPRPPDCTRRNFARTAIYGELR